MTKGEESGRKVEMQKQQVDANPVDMPDGALESEAGAIEGKVAEIAKTGAGENLGTSTGQQDDGKQAAKKDDGVKDDRAALKAKLLRKAPKEAKMRKQVEKVLLKKKSKLESQIKKHKRRRNYHLLSLAVMRLRLVVHQLEELAKAGYEKLKDMWLSVVHKLA